MIPRYLIHYNFTLIRDFLDLFFLILPGPSPFSTITLEPWHLAPSI